MRKIQLFLFALFIAFITNSCHLGRDLIFLAPDMKDIDRFPSVAIEAGNQPFHFFRSDEQLFLDTIVVRRNDNTKEQFSDILYEGNTLSFIVIRNDTVLSEYYGKKKKRDSRMASFSLAKSFIGALMGIAVNERYIGSIDEPITNYVPELLENDKRFEEITIKHLLDMTDGIRIRRNEASPNGDLAKLYYGRKQWRVIKNLKIEVPPGERWKYNNVNSTLLGLAISRSSGMRLEKFMEQKLWQPLGMEYDATWTIDNKKDSMVKAFCCLGARSIDYAKFGRLYLNYGYHQGKEIVPSYWVEQTICQDSCKTVDKKYQMHWWPSMEGDERFEANGHLGQLIYVKPSKNLIIVRNGIKRGKDTRWFKIVDDLTEHL